MTAISAPDVKARMKDALTATVPDVSPAGQAHNIENDSAPLSLRVPEQEASPAPPPVEEPIRAEWSDESFGRPQKSSTADSEPNDPAKQIKTIGLDDLSEITSGLRSETPPHLVAFDPTAPTSPRHTLLSLAPSRLIFLQHVLANRAHFDHEFTSWARIVQDTGLSLIGVKRIAKDLAARGIIRIEFDQLRRSGSRVYIEEEFARALETLNQRFHPTDPTDPTEPKAKSKRLS